MKSIRRNVFETNSSSTHSVAICSKEDFALWKSKKMIFDGDADKLITPEAALNKVIKSCPDLDTTDKENLSEAYQDCQLYTYKDYMEEEGLEYYDKKYTSKSGDEIVIFGKYGNDNY